MAHDARRCEGGAVLGDQRLEPETERFNVLRIAFGHPRHGLGKRACPGFVRQQRAPVRADAIERVVQQSLGFRLGILQKLLGRDEVGQRRQHGLDLFGGRTLAVFAKGCQATGEGARGQGGPGPPGGVGRRPFRQQFGRVQLGQ